MNRVLREEKKYLISLEHMSKQRHFMEQLLKEDAHNGDHGYIVRSLYFDTINNKDYVEKEDGIELRRKIRLRTYDANADFAMLEMKQKEGANQLKRSLRITREDAKRLIACDYSPLLHYDDAFACECFALMHMQLYRPKTVVEYRRIAFVAKENNTRITFDHNVVASEACFDITDPTLLLYPVFAPFHVILEVKFNGFLLSYVKDLLDSINKEQLSASKYCLARKATLNYFV